MERAWNHLAAALDDGAPDEHSAETRTGGSERAFAPPRERHKSQLGALGYGKGLSSVDWIANPCAPGESQGLCRAVPRRMQAR